MTTVVDLSGGERRYGPAETPPVERKGAAAGRRDTSAALETAFLSFLQTLEERYADRLLPKEFDHLAACFALGLTTPFYGKSDPGRHLDMCRRLLALRFSAERVRRALEDVPQEPQPWVLKAFEAVEQLGLRNGERLREMEGAPADGGAYSWKLPGGFREKVGEE